MKRTFTLFIAIIVATATANAQVFIEGSVNFRHTHSSTSYDFMHSFPSEIDASSSSWGISPNIGYWLNNKVAIGISPMFDGVNHNTGKDRSRSISIFGRYKLWEREKFSILIETPVGYGTHTSKHKAEISSDRDRDYSMSYFHVSALPLISYKLGERFDIVAHCNFLYLGFSSTTDKNKMEDGSNIKSTSNQFNFGAKSSVFDSLGDISIGFVYNFKNKSSQR